MEETIKSVVLGLCSGGIYALLAISYVVIYKSTRVFPFSQAAVLIIGAYVMWFCLMVFHLPIWVGFLMTCGAGDRRRKGVYASASGAAHPGPHRRYPVPHASPAGSGHSHGAGEYPGIR